MNTFVFANYVRVIQSNTSPRMDDFDLVSTLLYMLIDNYSIEDKNGSAYIVKKPLVSKLMNCKENIPKCIKDVSNKEDILETLSGEMEEFLDDKVSSGNIKGLIRQIKSAYESDVLIDKSMAEDFNASLNNPKQFMAKTFLYVLNRSNIEKITKTTIWNRDDDSISVIESDLLKIAFNKRYAKGSRIVVIPVNTTFELGVDEPSAKKPRVSSKTIHGKWINRLVSIGYWPDDINKLIAKSFKIQNQKIKSEYPIGTIAAVNIEEAKDVYFYLLAVSKFDKNNNAHATESDIKKAVKTLADFYCKNGQGYPLYLPLVGTGMSRARLTRRESIELIKNALLANKDMISGEINIVVYEKDTGYLKED